MKIRNSMPNSGLTIVTISTMIPTPAAKTRNGVSKLVVASPIIPPATNARMTNRSVSGSDFKVDRNVEDIVWFTKVSVW